MSNNMTILDNFTKKTDQFFEEIKTMQAVFDGLQRKRDDIIKREKILFKEREEMNTEESKFENGMLNMMQNLFAFQKETYSVLGDMYRRAYAEATFRAQAEAAQRALVEAAQKIIAEASQRAKVEAEYRLQAESNQRKLYEQAQKAQAEAAERIQVELSKSGLYTKQDVQQPSAPLHSIQRNGTLNTEIDDPNMIKDINPDQEMLLEDDSDTKKKIFVLGKRIKSMK